MLVKQVLVSALLAPAALAATNADTVFSNFENLQKRVSSARDCFQSFNGGVVQILTCGYDMVSLLTSSTNSNKELADLDSLPADKVQTFLDHYHDMHVLVGDALNTVSSKADSIDEAGLTMIAEVLLRTFAGQSVHFETMSKQKLPAANHSELDGPIKTLGDQFDKAIAKFS